MTTDQPLNIKAFFNLFLIEEGAHSQCHKRTRTNKNKTQNPTNQPQFQVIWKTFAQTTRTGAQRNPEGGIHVENIKIHKVRTSGSTKFSSPAQTNAAKPIKQQQSPNNSKSIAVLPFGWTSVNPVRCLMCLSDHLWPHEGSEGLPMNKVQQRTNWHQPWISNFQNRSYLCGRMHFEFSAQSAPPSNSLLFIYRWSFV